MFVTLHSRKKSSVIWIEHDLRTEFQEGWILVQPKAPRARVRRNFDELLSQAVHARISSFSLSPGCRRKIGPSSLFRLRAEHWVIADLVGGRDDAEGSCLHTND